MEVNGKRERVFLLGNAVSHSRSTYGLVSEVLKTQTAGEKALRTFLLDADGRRGAKGDDSYCLKSLSPNYTKYCEIIQIVFTEPTEFEPSVAPGAHPS